MGEGFDLNRFVTAQERSYPAALAELRAGLKTGHWMWFIFPQHVALGRSETARFYGIGSLPEARAYLAHPLLGNRLREASTALLAHRGEKPETIMGGIDALKLRSSMTLFEAAAENPQPFAAVLDQFYGGGRDAATLRLIESG